MEWIISSVQLIMLAWLSIVVFFMLIASLVAFRKRKFMDEIKSYPPRMARSSDRALRIAWRLT